MQCLQWKQFTNFRIQKNQKMIQKSPVVLKKYVRKVVHLENVYFDRLVEDIELWLKEDIEEKEEVVDDMVLEDKV
jgi:hypothetical protein